MKANIPDAPVARRGFILILSSPSGAGKSTLTRLLSQNQELDLRLSVSATTRPKRPSEIDQVHYSFMDRQEFEALRDRDGFLEWAEVHGNLYGTPRAPVEKTLASGHDMVFDIDWQGTLQVVEKMKDDVVTVFILPPSMTELRNRLVRRAEDSPQVIDARLAAARDEIARWENYDYVLVNEDLDQSYNALLAIIAAERLKRRRQPALAQLVEALMQGPLPTA
ncbi:guanylate kinase [Camelimonas abortus]|uniref:Guanylate kinase n=1 Tax=Camelimonas abortus TaxID=1017184 RepID=A0ABV7LIZ7_9HYPH